METHPIIQIVVLFVDMIERNHILSKNLLGCQQDCNQRVNSDDQKNLIGQVINHAVISKDKITGRRHA